MWPQGWAKKDISVCDSGKGLKLRLLTKKGIWSKQSEDYALGETQGWASFLFDEEIRRINFHNKCQQITLCYFLLWQVFDIDELRKMLLSFLFKHIYIYLSTAVFPSDASQLYSNCFGNRNHAPWTSHEDCILTKSAFTFHLTNEQTAALKCLVLGN